MSRRGRSASLPPAGHVRPDRLAPDGLVVHHYNIEGRIHDYDFANLPVAEPLQRSLANLFAGRCTPDRWTAHKTSGSQWVLLQGFAKFLASQERPPRDLEEFTAALIDRWWLSKGSTGSGRAAFRAVCSLLLQDERLQAGPVADALCRRVPAHKSRTQSYSPPEFEQIKVAARRAFRSALLRIEENARYLERWHAGQFTEGSREWVVGKHWRSSLAQATCPGRPGPAAFRRW